MKNTANPTDLAADLLAALDGASALPQRLRPCTWASAANHYNRRTNGTLFPGDLKDALVGIGVKSVPMEEDSGRQSTGFEMAMLRLAVRNQGRPEPDGSLVTVAGETA